MKVLVTGAKGFLGSHIIQKLSGETDWHLSTLERLPNSHFSAFPDRLAGLGSDRLSRHYHDLRAPISDELLTDLGHIDLFLHIGAEVQAARSILNAQSFVESNAVGTFNALEAARKLEVGKFIYVSSSEVFGKPVWGHKYSEDEPLCPLNPYAAAKAAGEMLARSYHTSFGLPIIIVRPTNLFGIKQNTDRFIPMIVKKYLSGHNLNLFMNKSRQSLVRQWLHVDSCIDVILHLQQHGTVGEAYNVPGVERTNMDIAKAVGFTPDRLEEMVGPDTIQLINNQKLLHTDWRNSHDFDKDLADTIQWYKENPKWLS